MGSLDSGYYDEVAQRSAAKERAFRETPEFKQYAQRKAESMKLLKACRNIPCGKLTVNDIAYLLLRGPSGGASSRDHMYYYTELRLTRLKEIAARAA